MAGRAPNQWEAQQQQQRSSGSANGGSTPSSAHSPNFSNGAAPGYGAPPPPGFTSYGPGTGPAPHPRGMPAPHSMYGGGAPHGMGDGNYDPRLASAPSGYYGGPPAGYTSQPPSHVHAQQQQQHQHQQHQQQPHRGGPPEGYHNPAYAHANNNYPPHGAVPPPWTGHGAPSVLAPTYAAAPASEEYDGRNGAQQGYGQAPEGEEGADEGEEDMIDDDGEGKGKGRANAQKGTSDFVKKLFKMLNDTSYSPIVAWSASGESFVVKNMNDFTKHVLPRHFRHSNFASFVRQLNKYDFHKVKNPEEQAHSTDQVWEFKHPEFLRGREDLLENVKRKLPTGKKVPREGAREGSPTMPGAADAANSGAAEYGQLKNQVALLTQSQDQMSSHINSLTKQYQGVIGEMLTFQRNMVQQDQLMQQLIQYLMQESAKKTAVENGPAAAGQLTNNLGNSAFLPPAEAQNIISSYTNLARDSFATMSHVAARLSVSAAQRAAAGEGSSTTSSSGTSGAGSHATTSATSAPSGMSPESGADAKGKGAAQDQGSPPLYFHPPHFDAVAEAAEGLHGVASALGGNPDLAAYEAAGLRVYTVGTLQPRQEGSNLLTDGSTSTSAMNAALTGRASPSIGADGSRPYGINVPSLEELPASMPRIDRRASVVPSPLGTPDTSGSPPEACMADSGTGSGSPTEGGGTNMLRVRRSTYVPGWAVPPRVLVVDDNDVCRNLSSKFLQVFGCAIDVAVDGVNAVNKMNLEKYDLVLMDIVMPNLDGVSATSLIREFDPRTPIISMTSNSGPNELLNYMSSGMNDILPKPFTKEGLLNMLEKHLIHLKTVSKMEEIPKVRGLPPVSDQMLQSVLTATAASAAQYNSTGSSSGSGPYGGASPWASMMGNGPDASARFTDLDKAEPNSDEDDEGVDNPLSGMGFSDEEYVSMLQNLLAAGSVSDGAKNELSDTVATALGVARGEGVSSGVRSKESTPSGPTRATAAPGSAQRNKRSADQADAPDGGKRARIAEVQAS